jgi:hypothetical protein
VFTVKVLSASHVCFREVDDLVGAVAHDSLSRLHRAQQIREHKLAAYAVEILPKLNLAISNLAIYGTQVEPDTLVVSLR